MLARVNLFQNFIIDLFKNINWENRDFLDIFIIAFLIYVAIKLLRETHSIPVVLGILALLGFYGVSLLFDLPLTSLVLRSFFSIFLIIIAIIFQRELRRFFSVFGFWGIARRFLPPSEMVIETISHTVSHFAREKTGALIIFPGREPIDRNLEGGYHLGGEVSEPLLLSIFDKTSPGHDGATIIEGNRIRKFAVHLPLAENIKKVEKFGLRHRAALGLSERSDAFIIAVSEERGVTSLFQNGKLSQLKDESELKRKLADFYREKFPKMKLINFSRWFLRNIILLVVSFLAAASIFLVVNSRFTFVQRDFIVSPEFTNTPSEILINDIVPQDIILTLEGRGSDFEGFNADDLRVIIDISSIPNISKSGIYRVPLEPENISMPFKMKLIKIEPLSLRLQIVKNIPFPSSSEIKPVIKKK